jgi:hypothetical protein
LILFLKINFSITEIVTTAGNICVCGVWFNKYGGGLRNLNISALASNKIESVAEFVEEKWSFLNNFIPRLLSIVRHVCKKTLYVTNC